MMYSIYYGELSESRKENWDNGDDNPYEVLAWKRKIEGYDWLAFLAIAKKLFKEQIQIDWGSFAWKASKEDILKLKKQWKSNIEEIGCLQDGIDYGVVFIEES